MKFGHVPTVSVEELLHPDYNEPFEVKKSWGKRLTLSQLTQQMSVLESGRKNLHYQYILKRVAELKTSRDFNFNLVMDVAEEGNSHFAEPRDDKEVWELARSMFQENPWRHQANRVRSLNEQTSLKAEKRYLDFENKLHILKTVDTFPLPSLGDSDTFSKDELTRANNFEGRRGTSSHLAHVLGIKPRAVREVLSEGRKKYGVSDTSVEEVETLELEPQTLEDEEPKPSISPSLGDSDTLKEAPKFKLSKRSFYRRLFIKKGMSETTWSEVYADSTIEQIERAAKRKGYIERTAA